MKKANETDLKQIDELKQKVYTLLDLSLDLIHTRFVPFRNKHSPKVSAISKAATKKEHNIEKRGF